MSKWQLGLGKLQIPSSKAKTGDCFGNGWLARRLSACHCRVVTRQLDTAFVKRVKSLKERPFIVQCADFRCMAYRDSSGKWMDYFNGDELKGEVTIVSEA